MRRSSFRQRGSLEPMMAVVVASGDVDPGDLRHLEGAAFVVAADGGARALAVAGRPPDLLVGDLDSADPALVDRLADAGTRVERHPADKEASDTELAVRAAIEAGATSLTILGATGGDRLDHELANVLLLSDSMLDGIDARIIHGASTIRVLHGPASIAVEAPLRSLVTLLPLGDEAVGVSTTGLRWPLDGAALRSGRSRGLSNEVVAAPASVRLERGTLLVVETANEGAQSS
jgi:thiamine pyrophosphokinase